MRTPTRALPLALCLCVLGPRAAHPQELVPGFVDSVIAQNIDLPVAFDFLPDGRLILAEQYNARLRLLVNGQFATTDPVITVPNVTTGGERGLLGVAVDPQFPARPYLYTHQTATGGRIRVSRFTVTGDLTGTGNGAISADPASRFDLLTTPSDAAGNHNGGTVRFGTDGMLYVSLGDDAQNCSAQLPDSLKGKILRLRVSTLPAGPGSAALADLTPPDNPFVASPNAATRLVYAYGLRNPFRVQIDEVRDALVIGDVGLDWFEEIDLLAMPGASGADIAPAGANFGWPWREGLLAYMGCGGGEPVSVPPVYAFDRADYPGASIIPVGAYHVRLGGSANFPNGYEGDVFFSEYASGYVFRLKRTGGTWAIAPPESGQMDPLVWAKGFGAVADWRVGPDGAIWACRQYLEGRFRNAGTIERIAYASTTGVPPGNTSFRLRLSAYPTPASGPVTLSLQADPAGDVRLRVYDLRGRLVRDLASRRTATWSTTVPVAWDGLDDAGREVPNGVYFARAEAAGGEARCRVVLAR